MANFPDLNDDGKVTRADVLKGRGVFKKGGKVKKMRKFADGGDTGFEPKSGALKMMSEYMRSEPKSDLDQLRSNIKSTGRGMASAAKSAAGATPMASGMRMGLKSVGNMAKDMPKSYEEEKGMKKGGKVSSASKRADGCAIRGKTRA
jgi:hypothetical protein